MPKGAGLLDYVNSENRLRYPDIVRQVLTNGSALAGKKHFRIAKLMKADRDANFIEKNEQGVTVNRWLSTGMLCASGASNETGMLTQKFALLGMLAVATRRASTRTNGSKSCSNIWSRCDDQPLGGYQKR